MSLRLIYQTLLMALLALSTSGCAALMLGTGAAAGAGAVAYSMGELKAYEEISYDDLRQLVPATLTKDLGLSLEETRELVGETRYLARDAANGRTQVRIIKLTSNASELRIRVGYLGDQARSQAVYDAIKRRIDD